MLSSVSITVLLVVVGVSVAAPPSPPPPVPASMPKLSLGPENAFGLFGVPVSGGGSGGAQALLDEQTLAGDPSSGKGGKVVSEYMMGYETWYYPPASGVGGGVNAAIDLGSPHLISDIYAHHLDGAVEGIIRIFEESPLASNAQWVQMVNTTQGAPKDQSPPVCKVWGGWSSPWCGWNISKTGITGRFITIAFLNPNGIGEVVVYGKPLSRPPPPPPQPPTPTPPKQGPLMKQFIGINSFVTGPIARQNVAGSIREYHDWVWDEGTPDVGFPNEAAKFSPDYSGFDSDAFYNRTFMAAIDTHVVLQGRPWCQYAKNASTEHFKAVDNNDILGTNKTMSPLSYTQIAGHFFQYAARYGKTIVNKNELKLAADQQQLSGLGWIKEIEVRNEPNGNWAGRAPFMSPSEHAALLSACYDGHEKTLPQGTGIRNADPHMLVSMGGLSGGGELALEYVTTMQWWFKANRKDKKFAADILNFHFYCNDDQTSKGASPEECQFEEMASNLTAWRDQNEPTLQVWLTEFGYDTSPHSPNLAPAYGSFDAEDVQGMWLIRCYMYLAVAKVDRAHMFMLADVVDNGWGKFATSGLTSSPSSDFAPKKSWYFVFTMSTILSNTRCVGYAKNIGVTTNASSTLKILKFAQSTERQVGATVVYALWLTSHTGAVQHGVHLNVAADSGLVAMQAVLVELTGNSTNGMQSSLAVVGGGVPVSVGEMPIFVMIGEELKPVPMTGPVPPVTPTPSSLCANSSRGMTCSQATANTTGPITTYLVCPGGVEETCPNGDTCMQRGDGVITCEETPGSACAGKPIGLFCTNASKPSSLWPDPYITCPQMSAMWCPVETPTCTQDGATIKCV